MDKENGTFEGILDKPFSMLADRIVCDNYLSKQEEYSEEEKEQRINEYLSLHCEIEKCLYLTGATLLKCTGAPAGCNHFEIEGHDVYIDGLPAAASTDCTIGEHVKLFPHCEMQSSKEVGLIPCKPKIAYNKWLESCLKMEVGDAKSINDNSYLICMRGEGARIYPVTGNGITDEGLGVEEQIQELMDQIKGEEIESYRYEDMKQLPTIEILARLIYQEDHIPDGGRQNAIAFSVVNRLYYGNWCGSNDNNLYGVITSKGQYQALFDAENARKNTENGNHNAYWPPVDENALDSEKEGWENAKRLAAILYLAVETCVEGDDETGRGKCAEAENDDLREDIIEFMEEQNDCDGNKIENIIGYYQSFRSSNPKISASVYENEDKIVFLDENGGVVGNVFQEK